MSEKVSTTSTEPTKSCGIWEAPGSEPPPGGGFQHVKEVADALENAGAGRVSDASLPKFRQSAPES